MKIYFEKTVLAEALVTSKQVMSQDGGYKNFPYLKVVTQTFPYPKNIKLGPGSPGLPGPLLGCCSLSCFLPCCLPCSLPRSLPCSLPCCPLSSLVFLPTLLPEHLGSSMDNCSSSSDHFGLVPLAF